MDSEKSEQLLNCINLIDLQNGINSSCSSTLFIQEATCTYDLPQLLPRPMVRGGEFLNPPPTRPFKINRSPGFTFPPPSKHLVAKWSNAGRISPTVELPSPAGQFFPTSSPRTYSATSPSLLYHKPGVDNIIICMQIIIIFICEVSIYIFYAEDEFVLKLSILLTFPSFSQFLPQALLAQPLLLLKTGQ